MGAILQQEELLLTFKNTIMNTKIELRKKLSYISPKIEQIILDNTISLALESSPPEGPDEASIMHQEYFNNNAFKNEIA